MSAAEIQQMELPFSQADKVQMLVDSNRHLEEENEALREEVAMLRRMLFGKKSEKLIHEKIALEEPEEQDKATAELPATDQAEARNSVQPKRKRRLSATVTKEIEHLVIPDEVLQNPLAYTRLPESSDRVSRRLEYVPDKAIHSLQNFFHRITPKIKAVSHQEKLLWFYSHFAHTSGQ